MRASDVITRTIGAHPDQESLRWIDSVHMKQYRILSIAGLTGCFVCLLGPLFQLSLFIQMLGLATGVACIVLRTVGRKRFENVVASRLDMQCDPVLYCRWTLAFLTAGRPAGGHVRGVWDYAYGLMWQGRWHDAIKLVRTLEPELDNPAVAFVYDSFMADCAFALRDPEKLSAYIQAMKGISHRGIAREARLHAAEMEPLRDLLQHERDGRLDEAQRIVDEILADGGLLPIERVLASLHKAECTPDQAQKRALLDYVAANGGTTWCAARARDLKAQIEAQPTGSNEAAH